ARTAGTAVEPPAASARVRNPSLELKTATDSRELMRLSHLRRAGLYRRRPQFACACRFLRNDDTHSDTRSEPLRCDRVRSACRTSRAALRCSLSWKISL